MTKKVIFIAICGRPNIGKSTFLNNFLKINLCPVSFRPQTTRNSIRGVMTDKGLQIIFIDTPGVMTKTHSKIHEKIVNNAHININGADLGLFFIDAKTGFNQSTRTLATEIKMKIPKLACIINKIDAVNQANLYKIAQDAFDSKLFEEIFPISALKESEFPKLLKYISENAKIGEWYYDEDDLTDKPNALIASDISRSCLLNLIKEEIPYEIEIVTERFKFEENFIDIFQKIIIKKDSHKPILLGRKGEMIKKIKRNIIAKLQNFYNQEINLNLLVKIDKNYEADI